MSPVSTTMNAGPGASPAVPRSTFFLLSVMCGISIASAYYVQPLLPTIGRALGATEVAMGLVPTMTQIGIGLGVALLMPMGDIVDTRKLVLVLVASHVLALAGVASAQSVGQLQALSFALGATTVTPYLLPVLAARLAPASERGQVTGLLARGIFAGILLARTASGSVGYALDWRAIYWIAVVAMLVMGAMFGRRLPAIPSQALLSYPQALRSLWTVLSRHAVLRRAALTQGLLFGGFNAFWVSLAYHLESPRFALPSYVAGLFGVIGLAGAMCAPMFGRLADRRGADFAVRQATRVTFAAWVVLALFGSHLAGLITGVILLDLGTTASHVSNQARIYELDGAIRNRVTTLYILGLFVGAALIVPLGTLAWMHAGWVGVCVVGGATSLLAVIANHRSAPHLLAGVRPRT